MSANNDLGPKFYRPIFKTLAIILGGFFLAPTHLLLSFYQQNEIFRLLAILISALIVLGSMFNMLAISIRAISPQDLNVEKRV
jgi:hypothetical protein